MKRFSKVSVFLTGIAAFGSSPTLACPTTSTAATQFLQQMGKPTQMTQTYGLPASHVIRDYRKRLPHWGGHVIRAYAGPDPVKRLTFVFEGNVGTYVPVFGSSLKGAMCGEDECTWDYEYVQRVKAPAGSLAKARLMWQMDDTSPTIINGVRAFATLYCDYS